MLHIAGHQHPPWIAPLSLGFIQRRPVLTYFVLAFALSWGGVLVVVGPGGIPATSEQSQRLFPIAFLAMLIGPSVAGLVMTGLVDGKAGFRELWTRLVRWRVGAGWYAVALLTTPLLATASLLALSLFSPVFLPAILTAEDRVSLLVLGLVVGLAAGIFEEVGWTGFAIPRLLRTHGVLATGLLVGLLWGAWHLLVFVWGSGDAAGSFSLALFLPGLLTCVWTLPAYRVLMVEVYDHTGSLLLAMLMHAANTATPLILTPPAMSGLHGLVYGLVLTAGLGVVIGAAGVARSGQRARASRPEESASTGATPQPDHMATGSMS